MAGAGGAERTGRGSDGSGRDRDAAGGCGPAPAARHALLGLRDPRRDPELADGEVVVDRELDPRRRQQGICLAPRVLGQVLLELADERALVRGELLPVGAREVDRVLVRDVDPRDRDGAVLVHLLGELPRQLDGLDMRSEGTPKKALEEALDLALDGAQDAHVPEAVSRLRVATGPERERRENAAEEARAEHDRERGDEWSEGRRSGRSGRRRAVRSPSTAPAGIR